MVDESFLPLDIRTATAILAPGGNAGVRPGRFLTVGKQLASVDSWQIALSLIFYRCRNQGTKAYQDKCQIPKDRKSVQVNQRKPYHRPRQETASLPIAERTAKVSHIRPIRPHHDLCAVHPSEGWTVQHCLCRILPVLLLDSVSAHSAPWSVRRSLARSGLVRLPARTYRFGPEAPFPLLQSAFAPGLKYWWTV